MEYKRVYESRFKKLSNELQMRYKELPVKERVKKKLIEKIIEDN